MANEPIPVWDDIEVERLRLFFQLCYRISHLTPPPGPHLNISKDALYTSLRSQITDAQWQDILRVGRSEGELHAMLDLVMTHPVQLAKLAANPTMGLLPELVLEIQDTLLPRNQHCYILNKHGFPR